MTGYKSKRAAAQDKLAQAKEILLQHPQKDIDWQREQQIKAHAKLDEEGMYLVHQTAQPKQEPVAFIEAKADNECADAYADGWNACVNAHKDTTPPQQEPVAWAVVGDGKFGKYELGQTFVDYEATHIYWKNRGYELVPVYAAPPQRKPLTDEYQSGYYDGKKAALAGREWNFCERCGKRTADLTVIHTCTPPDMEKALAQPEQQKPYRLLQDNGSKYFGESWDKAEQLAQEPVAFAGIEMWVGNTKIKLCLTQMQLHNAKEPWMLIEHMAEMCISKLKEKNNG